WTYRDDNGRPAKVFRRPVRGGVADDVEIYNEPEDGFFISTDVTESNEFILISCGDHERSEHLYIPASNPTAQPIVFHSRQERLMYTPTHWNDRWYILTNADDAVDFKIMSCPIDRTGRAHWRDYLPHQ